MDEVGIVSSLCEPFLSSHVSPGDVIVRIDSRYYRPAEVQSLLGDSRLAREILGWSPSISLDSMIEEMVYNDLELARRKQVLKENGFSVSFDCETRDSCVFLWLVTKGWLDRPSFGI